MFSKTGPPAADLGRSVPRGWVPGIWRSRGAFPALEAAGGVEAQVAGGLVRRVRAPERKGKRVESGKEEVKRWDLFCSERWPGGWDGREAPDDWSKPVSSRPTPRGLTFVRGCLSATVGVVTCFWAAIDDSL